MKHQDGNSGGKVLVGDFSASFLNIFQLYSEKIDTFSILRALPILGIFAFVDVGMMGHIIYYSGLGSLVYTDVADDLAGLVSSFTAYYIIVYGMLAAPKFRVIMHDIGDFTHFEMPEGFIERRDLLDRVGKVVTILLYLAMFVSWLAMLMSKCPDGIVDDCGLIITSYLFFDIFYTPVRQICMTLQAVSGFQTATVAFNVIWLLLIFPSCLVIYIRHLEKMLLLIPTLEGRPARKVHIRKCIIYHHRIIELHEAFRRVTGMLVMYATTAAVVISLTAYQMLTLNLRLQTMVHFTIYLSLCLFASLLGQKITDESEELVETVYMSIPWDGDVETMKDLMLVMIRTSRLMDIPTGKFGSLGHARFMDLLKSAYSFLTLMLNS